MRNLLVTGGAGTLGSSIIEALGDGYDRVIALDNFATGKRTSLPDRANLLLVEGDVQDDQLVRSIVGRFHPEHVIHAAASYKDPDDWAADIATNVLGASVLVSALRDHEPRRFIYLQTALCYGRPEKIPIPDTAPLQPFTSYGISKTAGEQYLLNSGLPVTSLRLANVTGPRLAIGPIPTFYQRLRAGHACFVSDSVRDFVDLGDFLSLLRLALADTAPTGPFNVSTGQPTSISDVYGMVAHHLGVEAPPPEIRPVGGDDVAVLVLDAIRTEEVFNWQCQVTAEQSIRNLLYWYDAFGVTDIYSHFHSDWGA